MNITFFGTNSLLLREGSSTLLIDPHFSRPSLIKLLGKIEPNKASVTTGLNSLGINTLDGILLTHTHYDHAMDAIEVIRRVGGVLVGSESAANLAKDAGSPSVDFELITPDSNLKMGEFNIRWFESQHIRLPSPLNWLMSAEGKIKQPLSTPVHFWGYQCGRVYALLINHMLIFGSAGYLPGAYQDCGVRVVVLGIGGLGAKPTSYLEGLYLDTVVKSGANQVLISHWDNFFQPMHTNLTPLGLATLTIDRLKRLGNCYGQTVRVLRPGKTIEI